MNRRQILQQILHEDFSEKEINLINQFEPKIRHKVAQMVNKAAAKDPKIPIEDRIADNVDLETYAKQITNIIFEKGSEENGVYKKVAAGIQTILDNDMDFAEQAASIASELAGKSLILNAKSLENFSLNNLKYSDLTTKFLNEVYNLKLSFGGGNTIGVGELLIALIFKNAKLLSHTKIGSKFDVYTIDTQDIVEIKADGGRLDGSGIRPEPLKCSELYEIIEKLLIGGDNLIKKGTDLTIDAEDEPDYQRVKSAKSIAIQDKNFRVALVTLKKHIMEFEGVNIFSRKSVQKLWLTEIPKDLGVLLKAVELHPTLKTKNDYSNKIELYADMMYEVYRTLYSRGDFSSEDEQIRKLCKELATNCVSDLNVTDEKTEEFVLLDTTIRAQIYMRLYKNKDKETVAARSGYLFFIKDTGSNIIGRLIDYTESGNGSKNTWRDHFNDKLKVTPSNDDRRAAHSVRVVK